MDSPRARASVAAGALCVAVLTGLASSAWADRWGLVVEADTVAVGALRPIVAFPNGEVVDMRRLIIDAIALAPDGDLLIHDLSTGRTRVAAEEVASVPLIGIDGAADATLGELVGTQGVVVLFGTRSDAPPDPRDAHTFLAHREPSGSDRYTVPPTLESVPEPGTPLGLAAGIVALVAMRRHARRREQR